MTELSASLPLVTAVIPTIGRAELRRAVDSVMLQTLWPRMELIIVVDRARATFDAVVLPDEHPQIRVIYTQGGSGGAHARNLGVSHSRGEWIAFLDDDDEWHPRKTEVQLNLAQKASHETMDLVVSSRLTHTIAGGNDHTRELPRKLIAADQQVAGYLFSARHPGAGRASLFTSTLFVHSSLARRVEWNTGLSRHQDWDWLISLEYAGARFLQSAEALATVNVGSRNSISASSDWESSLKWAREKLLPLGRRVFSDFVVAQTMRYALQARSGAGVASIARALVSHGTVPSLGPVIIGMSGIIRRDRMERLLPWMH